MIQPLCYACLTRSGVPKGFWEGGVAEEFYQLDTKFPKNYQEAKNLLTGSRENQGVTTSSRLRYTLITCLMLLEHNDIKLETKTNLKIHNKLPDQKWYIITGKSYNC